MKKSSIKMSKHDAKNKRKRQPSLHRGSKTRTVLLVLAKALEVSSIVIDEVVDILADPRYRYLSGGRPRSSSTKLKSREVRIVAADLARKGYIEVKKGGEVVLTKKANLELIREQIMAKQKPDSWDGKWRLLIFDIAEKKRHQRDFLRFRLKQWNFVELQRSVWATPYDIEKEVKKFIKLANIYLRGDIRFAVVDSLNKDSDLKKKFNV